MKIKTKTLVIAVLMMTVIASGVFLSLQIASAEENPDATGERHRFKAFYRHIQNCKPRENVWLVKRLLMDGVPETLQGEVSVVTPHILVLNNGEETINVVVPMVWVIDGEKLNLRDLFDGDPFSLGEEATIQTLMLELVKETHAVRSYFAYSIQIDGETATALLPFNIDLE